MTTIEKHIVKFIDDKFSFPYLHYNKVEQTLTNEFFLFDIGSGVMYLNDDVKSTLNRKFGEEYMDKIMLKVVNSWFSNAYKLTVKEIN